MRALIAAPFFPRLGWLDSQPTCDRFRIEIADNSKVRVLLIVFRHGRIQNMPNGHCWCVVANSEVTLSATHLAEHKLSCENNENRGRNGRPKAMRIGPKAGRTPPGGCVPLLFAFLENNVLIINKLSKTTVPQKSLKP
jgi:hypothetical protein